MVRSTFWMPWVRWIGVDGREDGVAGHPVQERPLANPSCPMVQPPVFGDITGIGSGKIRPLVIDGIGAKGAPTGGGARLVILTPGQIEDLLARSGKGGGGGREVALVLVIDGHRGAQHGHGLRLRDPIEIGVHEQRPIAAQRGEVVAVSIAMTHRVEDGGVGGVDDAVVIFVLDVIVEGVDDFTGGNAVGVVPKEPIIDRRQGDPRGERVVSAAQQAEVLLQQSGDFPLEAKQGGGDVAVGRVVGTDADGGVEGIGPSVVANIQIQVAEFAGGQEEGVIGGAVVDAGVDAQSLALVQHGFVDLDEAQIGEALRVKGHVPFPPMAGLLDDAAAGINRVVEKVGRGLVERIDPLKHALDPALGQLGRGPGRPIGRRRVGRRVNRAVAHGHEIVAQGLDARNAQRVV